MRSAIVIGAGMIGLATAWHLQEEGVDVTVVERGDVAAGSSWGNAGWLAPALTLPLNDPAIVGTGIRAVLQPSSPVYVPPSLNPRLLRFLLGFVRHCTPARWGAAMEVFAKANDMALDAFAELDVAEPTKPADPFLAAFASVREREALVTEFERAADRGSRNTYEVLTADEVHELEPALGEGVRAGVRLHGQRFIDPGDYVRSLADAVRSRGGAIHTGRSAATIEDRGTDAVVRTAEGIDFSAEHVVVATGSWLPELARPHGVRALVQAGRGYSFTVHPEAMPAGPVYFPAQRVACTPLGPVECPSGFRVAGMMEFRSPDAPLDPRRIRAIVDATRPMLRGIDWQARQNEWVGARPCTVDGLPLIGRTRSPRVHVNGGHGMWGIALGPLSGRLLAHSLTGGDPDPLLRAFDPLR